ncbi:hypothetical protein [Nonomuraea sp. B1E8]|uniref:hypothetical protein n=1 Tax=unclassified Nonomuraea TaxID=2593643 RepID=UPI00325E0BFF
MYGSAGRRRIASVALITVGAAAGALCQVHPGLAVLVAAVVVPAVTSPGHASVRVVPAATTEPIPFLASCS